MTMTPKTTNQIAKKLRLTDTNPTTVKLNKLIDLAGELGIRLWFTNQVILVEDRDRDASLPDLYMEDIEPDHWFEEFPPSTEFKLTYENPAYLKVEKELNLKYQQDLKNKQAAREAKLQAQQEEFKRTAKIAQEIQERQMLAELKAKYGE